MAKMGDREEKQTNTQRKGGRKVRRLFTLKRLTRPLRPFVCQGYLNACMANASLCARALFPFLYPPQTQPGPTKAHAQCIAQNDPRVG